MNSRIIFILLFSIFLSVSPFRIRPESILKSKQSKAYINYNAERYKARLLSEKNQCSKAAALLREVISLPVQEEYRGEAVFILYDLAGYYSVLGEKNLSLKTLEKAVDLGFSDYQEIIMDKNFRNISELPGFQSIVSKLKKNQSFWDTQVMNTPYRQDISENEKIAGLSRLWAEIKFNFANFDLVPELDLDAHYFLFLNKVRSTRSTFEFYQTLQEFCAALRDGHTGVIFPKELKKKIKGRLPFQTRLLEGKVIITKLFEKIGAKSGIVVGTEIVMINDIPVHKYAKQYIQPFQNSNTPQNRLRDIYEYALLRGPVGKNVTLKLVTPYGKTLIRKFRRVTKFSAPYKLVTFRKLEGGIGYIEINSFGWDEAVEEFDNIFQSAKKCNSLIIDLRENGGGSGRIGWTILSYFFDKPFDCFQWQSRLYIPIFRAWRLSEKAFKKTTFKWPADKSKYFDKPVVLLVRDRTGSMAENFCVAFVSMKRGAVIGSPTAGSSGTPLVFGLPGGGFGKVVTTRGSYPNGDEFIGKGIIPDIIVQPKISDIIKDRDVVLLEAVKYLRNIKKHDN